jgi:hypothetical protein
MSSRYVKETVQTVVVTLLGHEVALLDPGGDCPTIGGSKKRSSVR